MSSEAWTYAKAGVDLGKHRQMHSFAHEVIQQLMRSVGVEVYDVDGYAPYIKLGDLEVTLHADGVGTKTMILEEVGKLEVAGWDAVAMNVNDVACTGFKPVALSVYIALPESDEEKFRKIMTGVYEAARFSRCVVVSGETAIMPDLVTHPDVCCFLIGVRIARPRPVQEGDVVIGVESNGVHANGYTLIRKAVLPKIRLDQHVPELGRTLGEELSRPTHIYSNLVLDLYVQGLIKVAAHITGGAFTKLKRIIKLSNVNVDIVLDSLPEPPPIFKLIQQVGNVPIEEMYRVFNMGVGLILFTDREHVEWVLDTCARHGFKAQVMGRVASGTGRIVIRLRDRKITY